MQQFKTLFKKEFSAYFSGCLAYFVIFVYLFASFGGAFYLKSFLAAKDSALFSLFSFQPYVLAVIIPAITMKLWAEEYKSNSAEFLLTLPLDLNKIVGAKFCAAVSFCSILALGLLPFVFYTAYWFKLDWLNIFCAYIGVELFILLFCSIGIFLSSLSNNLIISYLLSIFTFLLLVALPETKLIMTYHNFMFAEIGLFDVFYFVSFTILFLYLNKMIIEYRRNVYKNSGIMIVLLMCAAFMANSLICWGISAFDYKIDFTTDSVYSLKKASKRIISQIKTPLDINLFIAEDYLREDYAAAYYFEQVSRFLKKYNSFSKGLIKLNINKVAAFSEEENNLISKGIYALSNKKGSKNYFGAIIDNKKGDEEVITQFLFNRQVYLEEDIDRALLKAAFPELKKPIGVYFDGEQNLDDYEGIALILENEYKIGVLDNTSYQIKKTAAEVVLINPKVLSPVFMYAIDQYVLNGGKLVIFIDRNTENQLDNVNNQVITIEKLLRHWGIELGKASFDEGTVVEKFNNSQYPLKIKSACEINLKNDNLTILPIIENDGAMLGSLIGGEFVSYYNKNPYINTKIGGLMKPFRFKSDQGRIAIICDADILNEKNWIAENSPDRNIFGAIEKAGNGRFFLSLVDYMADNHIYDFLPKNKVIKNTSSIGDLIEKKIKQIDEAEYNQLKEDTNSLAQIVWEMADYDEEKVPTVMNLTDFGRQLQGLTKELNNMDYERVKNYNNFVTRLMIFWIIILPLIEALLVLIVRLVFARRKNKKIKEFVK